MQQIAINKKASMGAALHMAGHLGCRVHSENGKHCIITAPPAANTGAPDPDRHTAIEIARKLLPTYVEQHPKDWRLEAALATAIDYAEGRLDVMADPHALKHAKGYALQAAAEAQDFTSMRIAMITARACDPVVRLERVKRMVARLNKQ